MSERRRVGDLTSAERKEAPLFSGTMSYFPDALCAVAVLCKRANDKHNPGEPMHWSKDKSADHADCLARHLLDRGKPDEFGLDHRVAVAWRALSDLQTAIEEGGWDAVVGAQEESRGSPERTWPERARIRLVKPREMGMLAVSPDTVVIARLVSPGTGSYRVEGHGYTIGQAFFQGGEAEIIEALS